MAQLTDQAAALMGINRSMQEVTRQLGRLSLAAGGATHTFLAVNDLGQKMVHRHFLAEFLFGHVSHGGLGGGGGGGGGGGTASGRLGGFGGPSSSGGLTRSAWEGIGKPTDLLAHLGPDFAANPMAQEFLKKGGVPMADVAELHAHLTGGKEMPRRKFLDLVDKAATATDAAGNDVYDTGWLARLGELHGLGRDKYDQSRAHQAGLRMRGKHPDQRDAAGRLEAEKNAQLKEGVDNLKDWNKQLASVSAAAHRAFKGGFVGLASMADAASPDAFATLAGSFKLLAAQIGTTLLPQLVQLSSWVQQAAHWFSQLSPEQKARTGQGLSAGLIVAGGLALAPNLKATHDVLKGSGAYRLAGAAAVGLGSFALSHPGLAATAALGGAAMYYGNSSLRELKEAHDAALAGGALSRQGLLESSVYRRARDIADPAERKAFLNREQEEHRRGMAYHEAERAHFVGSGAPLRAVIYRGQIRSHSEQFGAHLRASEEAQAAYRELIEGKKYEGTPDQRDAKARIYQAANSLMLDLQNRTQPGYFSPEDIYKKIQLEALTQSPLQQELRDIALQQLEATLKMVDEMRKQEGLPPVPRLPG